MKMESSFFVSAKDEEEVVVDHQWDGYTLLLPCVSVGNVPQLACDLLVSSLLKKTSTSSASDQSDLKDLELVGYIRSSSVRPFAGPDPYSLHGPLLATSIQVFVSKAKKLVLIQQRSPIFKEFRTEFYNELSAWLSKHRFSLILLLSSSFDQYLAPAEKEKSSFPTKYLLGDGGAKALSTETKAFLEETLKVAAIEPSVDLYSKTAKPVSGDEQQQLTKPHKSGLRIHLPGSGSARAYLSTLGSSAQASSEILCLVMFCSEGDNRQHAFKLADTVAHLVNHKQAGAFAKPGGKGGSNSDFTWTVPFSWRTLFGDEPPAEIF